MLEARSVVHRYGGRVALDGVTLAIPDDEFVVLAGPNGSGKTTLCRQFNGLLEPDAGEVLVDGKSVASDPVAARTAVGMVFQHPEDQFVAATVGEDVAFGPRNLGLQRNEIARRVGEALSAVGLADRRDERIDALSGGERARVAIAGVLAMEPAHLVLDEPLAGLDFPSRESILDRLASLHRDGTGVVVVTHDLRDVIDLADRVVVMRDGKIALDATPEAALLRLESLGVRPP